MSILLRNTLSPCGTHCANGCIGHQVPAGYAAGYPEALAVYRDGIRDGFAWYTLQVSAPRGGVRFFSTWEEAEEAEEETWEIVSLANGSEVRVNRDGEPF